LDHRRGQLRDHRPQTNRRKQPQDQSCSEAHTAYPSAEYEFLDISVYSAQGATCSASTPPVAAALCNRRQSRILTIHRGEVYPDGARLAPVMISTQGHRVLRRRQRRALPAWFSRWPALAGGGSVAGRERQCVRRLEHRISFCPVPARAVAFGSKVGSIIAPEECRCSFVPMDPGRRIGETRQSYFVAPAFRSRISRSRLI
jgi:hypothetical protein